jgi:hypothetical protein
MKTKLVQEDYADYLRQAQPHLIIHVDPLGGPRFELAPYIRQGEYDREEIIDEGYDPDHSPLGCPVYWRIVNRGGEKLYCSTFLATRDQVRKCWGAAGLVCCDPAKGTAFARIETKLWDISQRTKEALI